MCGVCVLCVCVTPSSSLYPCQTLLRIQETFALVPAGYNTARVSRRPSIHWVMQDTHLSGFVLLQVCKGTFAHDELDYERCMGIETHVYYRRGCLAQISGVVRRNG